MNCPSCGQPNQDSAKFCAECGSPLSRACPGCGSPVSAGAKFCDQCGARLDVGGNAASPTPKKIQPELPKHLADAILRNRASLEGERRTVTVLFADAEGFTPLSERLDEEEVYNLIQGCSARMTQAVHRNEGTVTQFLGDGIMALFGAPIAHEDSARRAVRAGLDMLKALKDYSEEVKPRHRIECRFRVGLNTGPVVVGKISDNLEMDYTALGDTVNLASRMERLAEPSTLYISENTYSAVRDYFECEELGEREIKGKSRPVKAYRVIGESSIHTRFEAASARGLTQFVGRGQELAMLRSFFDRVKLGQGHVAFISGEAGIGKSRTLLEFRRSIADDGIKWLEGHCISFGQNIPYLPIIEILKANFGIKEGDSEAAMIAKIDAEAESWSEAARPAIAYVKYLLNLDPGDSKVAQMAPLERRAGFLEAVRTVALERSRRGPLVVLIEDVHWVDEKTEEAFATLADLVAAAPILLLLSHRPGYSHSLGERSYFSRLALGNLAAAESAVMVQSVLQTSHLPPDLGTLIASKAEGNPFYVEEVTKSLLETGVLERRNGGYDLGRSLQEIVIPNTIQEVILSRIDRLERPARGAIQLASVIGREFTVRLLNRISDLDAKLDDLLSELKSLELIYEVGHVSELSYMFKHALTHDVAYSTLLVERRRALHRIVAAAIEELYADRLAEHYETLAHHYERAQAWDKAFHYLAKAGQKAEDNYANQEALIYYKRAIEVSERVDEAARKLAIEIAMKRGLVNVTIGRLDAAAADFELMESLAGKAGARQLEGAALTLQGMAAFWAHTPERAEEIIRKALAIGDEGYPDVTFGASIQMLEILQTYNRLEEARKFRQMAERLVPQIQEPALLSLWAFYGAHQPIWQGRFNDAVEHVDRWRRQGNLARDATSRFGFRWSEGLARVGRGEYESALHLLQEVLAAAERAGEVLIRTRTLNTIGWLYGELEMPEEAMRWNQRGLDAAEEAKLLNPEVENNARINLGDNLAALGRLDEAEERYARVERTVRNPQGQDVLMMWRYSQHLFHSYGELCRRRGDTDRALGFAEECLAAARSSGSRKNVVKALRLKALVAMARGDLRAPEGDLRAALEMAREVGNPSQLWKTLYAMGDLKMAQGRPQEAAPAYRSALDVIDGVALNLKDSQLRERSFKSPLAEALRAKLSAVHAD